MLARITIAAFAALAFAAPAWGAEGQSLEQVSFGSAMLQMVFALAIVLALLLLLYWFMRRFNPGQLVSGAGGSLKVWGKVSLGARKSLVVVETGRVMLVLGVGEKEITLLRQIEGADEIAEMKAKGGLSFKKAFKKAVASEEKE